MNRPILLQCTDLVNHQIKKFYSEKQLIEGNASQRGKGRKQQTSQGDGKWKKKTKPEQQLHSTSH